MLLDYGANAGFKHRVTHETVVDSVFYDYDFLMQNRLNKISIDHIAMDQLNNLIMIAAILRNAGQRFDTPDSSNKSSLDKFGLWVGAELKAQVLAEFLEKIDRVDINSIRVTDIVAQSPEEAARLSPQEEQSVALYRNGRYAEMRGSRDLNVLSIKPQSFLMFQPKNNTIDAETAVKATVQHFRKGEIQSTGRKLDVAIDGDGFFQVINTNGNIAYTRNLSLTFDEHGYLVSEICGARALKLKDEIRISKNLMDMRIQKNGDIEAILSNDSEPQLLGTIKLAKFRNPESLQVIGPDLYSTTKETVDLVIDNPGRSEIGTLLSGHQEREPIDLVSELVQLTMADIEYRAKERADRFRIAVTVAHQLHPEQNINYFWKLYYSEMCDFAPSSGFRI